MGSQISDTQRTLNYVYLVFFAIHIPVILFVDLVRFYPEGTAFEFSLKIQSYYIDNFNDKFFSDEAPAWFTAYLVLEGVYHLPLSGWMLNALLEEHPLVPLHLLIFAMQTALTTFTCLVELLSWPDYSTQEQLKLCSLYVPYLAIAVVMGVDSSLRLKNTIEYKSKTH